MSARSLKEIVMGCSGRPSSDGKITGGCCATDQKGRERSDSRFCLTKSIYCAIIDLDKLFLQKDFRACVQVGKFDDLYQKIIVDGDYKVRFSDIKYLLENTGFALRISGGDHFKYSLDGVSEIINIQPDKNDRKMAKEYQVKQIQKIYKKYKLGGNDDER